MQSYPFTSQVTYDDQDLPIYDRAVDSAFLREVFARYFSDGIFYKPTNAFQVLTGTGMNIHVNPGACHIQGAIGIEKSQRTLSLQSAESMDRIDTVVLRLDLSLAARSIDLYIVKGTASVSPQTPALTRNSTIWELGIANIFVPKNSSSITQQRITDTRLNNSRCGIVAQTIGELDTSPYFDQVQAMITELKKTIDGIENGSGYVFSLEGKSGNLTLNDVGALPTAGGTMSGAIGFEGGGSIQYADSLLKLSNGGNILAVGPDGVTSNGKTIPAVESVSWTPRAELGNGTPVDKTQSKGTAYKIGNLVLISLSITFAGPYSGDQALYLTDLPYNLKYGTYPYGDYFNKLVTNRFMGCVYSSGDGYIMIRRMEAAADNSIKNNYGNDVMYQTIYEGNFIAEIA